MVLVGYQWFTYFNYLTYFTSIVIFLTCRIAIFKKNMVLVHYSLYLLDKCLSLIEPVKLVTPNSEQDPNITSIKNIKTHNNIIRIFYNFNLDLF